MPLPSAKAGSSPARWQRSGNLGKAGPTPAKWPTVGPYCPGGPPEKVAGAIWRRGRCFLVDTYPEMGYTEPMTPRFTKQTSLRLPPDLLMRIDALAAKAQKRAGPGARVDRSDLIRDMLTKSVAEAEKRHTKGATR